MHHLSLRNVDPAIDAALREAARRDGLSKSEAARRALARGLGVTIRRRDLSGLGAALTWMGRRSLPVYVGHGLVILPIGLAAPASWFLGRDLSATGVVLLALTVTAAAVGVALAVYGLLSALRLRWLYVLPPRAGRSVVGWVAPLRPGRGAA